MNSLVSLSSVFVVIFIRFPSIEHDAHSDIRMFFNLKKYRWLNNRWYLREWQGYREICEASGTLSLLTDQSLFLRFTFSFKIRSKAALIGFWRVNKHLLMTVDIVNKCSMSAIWLDSTGINGRHRGIEPGYIHYTDRWNQSVTLY